MKAIQTSYRGFLFRSRLEARWAVFFDTRGIKWEYEPEGFELGDGFRYLPDFWLPDFCLYVDVKPIGGDHGLAVKFCRVLEKSAILADGPPDFYPLTVATGEPWGVTFELGMFRDKCLVKGENRLWYQPAGEYDHNDPQSVRDFVGPQITEAIYASRSARFEFGETPDPMP